MKPTVRTSLIAMSAVLLMGLAGCERAEQAADSVTREVGRMAAEEARKALQGTGEAINRGIDNAQDTTRRWLDGAERAAQERSQEGSQDRDEGERAPESAPRNEQNRGDRDGKSLSI